MKYRKIEFAQFPYIYFAHEYKTNRYSLHFMPEKQCIEITYIEQGDITQTFADGRAFTLCAPGVLVNIRDREYTLESAAPVHRHSTICFIMDYQVTAVPAREAAAFCVDSSSVKAGAPLTALLPECFEIDSHNGHIEKLIKQIVGTYSGQTSASTLICAGMILRLMGEITEEGIRKAMTESNNHLSYGSVVYSRKAMEYIARCLDQKLYVDDIAASLGISSGYLSNLFKEVTGQTLVQYINRVKLSRIKEILNTNPGATLRQAGECVGIYDENYLSRIFKKYNGISAQEYRKQQIKSD